MSDLNADVQAAMDQIGQILKGQHPDKEFFLVLVPFHISQMAHLSTEQRTELEKRVVRSANNTFAHYLRHPEKRSD